MSKSPRTKLYSALLVGSIVVCVNATLPALAAETSFLQQGIAKYEAGAYSEAVGLLGAAESSEFNNPTLHYYMASAYLKMALKSDAIREYQISLALQPKGVIGDYSRRALDSLGAPRTESSLTNGNGTALSGRSTANGLSGSAASSSKAKSWLSEQLAALDKEQQQQKEGLESAAAREIKETNERAARDRDSVVSSIPQTLGFGRTRSSNPEYDVAMGRIETDTINKVNEINSNLRKKEAALDVEFEERARGYESSGSSGVQSTAMPMKIARVAGASSTPSSSDTASATMPLVTAGKSAPVSSNSRRTDKPGAIERPALPAILTPLGWIPLNNRILPRGDEGLIVNLESDGSWEQDGVGRRIWKAELVDDNNIKNSWQDWQRLVADTIRDALLTYRESFGVAFRMQVDRNGDIFQITPDSQTTDPADRTVMRFINYLRSYLSAKPFPAIPSSSGVHLVHVHVQVKSTVPDQHRAWHPWWQEE